MSMTASTWLKFRLAIQILESPTVDPPTLRPMRVRSDVPVIFCAAPAPGMEAKNEKPAA
jgi:hypothetical protein